MAGQLFTGNASQAQERVVNTEVPNQTAEFVNNSGPVTQPEEEKKQPPMMLNDFSSRPTSNEDRLFGTDL